MWKRISAKRSVVHEVHGMLLSPASDPAGPEAARERGIGAFERLLTPARNIFGRNRPTRSQSVASAESQSSEVRPSAPIRLWDDPVCELPNDEDVRLRAIWVAEAYPPSCVPDLIGGAARQGWNLPNRYGAHELSAATVQQARSGRGIGFVNLGRMARAAEYNDLLGYRTVAMPQGITHVDVTAHQPVPSITILVFCFVVSENASRELTGLFQRENPALRDDPNAWLQRQGPSVSQMQKLTQAARNRQRAACVSWVRSRVPGLFARWDGAVTAELITLEKAEPLRDSGSYHEPYLQALGLGGSHGASELWGRQGLRLGPMAYRGSEEGHLLFCGRNEELYELDTDPDGPRSIVECVARYISAPMVPWALHEAVRRAVEKISQLRDAVAESSDSESLDVGRRLEAVQREFMRVTVDTVPMEREIREFCESDKTYHERGADEFRPVECTTSASDHAFETVRKRTLQHANILSRASGDLREMMSTTSRILNTLSQQRATEENLALQRRVYWMTIVFGILAALISAVQLLR